MKRELFTLLVISQLTCHGVCAHTHFPEELVSNRLHAKELPPAELKAKIDEAFQTKDYVKLGAYLKDSIHYNNELGLVSELAKETGSQKLMRASRFALAFVKQKEKIDFPPGELLQIALYILEKLPQHIRQGEYFLSKTDTGLTQPIEYDPVTKQTFIILDGVSGAYLGKGSSKTVAKTILFDPQAPEIFARLKPNRPKELELHLMDILKGSPGLIKIKAITKREQEDEMMWTAYTQVYKAGSLASVLKMEYRFTLKEKLKIALDILTGLNSLHNKKIVHRDLKPSNCLVDILPDEKGKRKVSAVIADFGCASTIQKAVGIPLTIAGTHTAPEAYLKEEMKGKDFFKSDIFATGCMLYKLYYRRVHPWKTCKVFKDEKFSRAKKYQILAKRIDKTIKAKRELLARKKAQGALSVGQEFEHLILSMLHVNPQKRGSAKEIREKLLQLYQKAPLAKKKRKKPAGIL